jgi:glycerol-3-phosphate acyltransferase PlsY
MVTWLLCIVSAYLLGSIPCGVIIGHLKGVDIRQRGSRNIGATNVGRVLGRPLGLLCFVLDVLKGAAPVLAAGLLSGSLNRHAGELPISTMWLWQGVAAAAVLGHTASPWLGFRGGKGVATAFGAMLAMWPLMTFAALFALAVWYLVLRISGYMSVASMAGALSLPVGYLVSIVPREATAQPLPNTLEALGHGSPPLVVTGLLALLVVHRHRANIGRLRRGEEPRVQDRAKRGDVLAPSAEDQM